MKHEIETAKAGPYALPMADAIQTCVHCGFCLPTCPTYQELGQESDSPRGRIVLMKETLEGKIDWSDAKPHIDRCLGCVACETACPSGVKYGELISPFRAELSARVPDSWGVKLKRWLVFQTLPHPGRFRLAMRLGRWTRWTRPLLPNALRPMLDLIPSRLEKAQPLDECYPVKGTTRARVALLAGCAQQVLRPEINLATIRVLNQNGVEVVVPRDQGCCGALAWHVGNSKAAIEAARTNIAAFDQEVDAVVTNAAGCGSGIHDYETIMRDTDLAEQACQLAERTVDVSVFLDRLGLETPPDFKEPVRVAYHDACHLRHAQKVQSQPRRLLSQVRNLELVEIRASETCCGSAGTYNIDQPELARNLGQRKAESIRLTKASVVATGNIGCLVQIENHLREDSIRILHTMEVMDRAYQRRSLSD